MPHLVFNIFGSRSIFVESYHLCMPNGLCHATFLTVSLLPSSKRIDLRIEDLDIVGSIPVQLGHRESLELCHSWLGFIVACL